MNEIKIGDLYFSMLALAFVVASIFSKEEEFLFQSAQRDTLYYIVFMDLFEKDYRYGNSQKDNKTLVNERRDVAKQIHSKLSQQYVLIPADSCFKDILNDFQTRNDSLKIQKYCDQCRVSKKLLIVNSSWTYLSEPSFKELEFKHRSSDLLFPYTYITGTWWDIHVLVYDPGRRMVIYSKKDKHEQWDNRKPMKRLPGVGHRRFFSWALRDTKKALKRERKSKSKSVR